MLCAEIIHSVRVLVISISAMPIYRCIQLKRSFIKENYVIKESIIIIVSTHHFVAKLNSSIRIVLRLWVILILKEFHFSCTMRWIDIALTSCGAAFLKVESGFSTNVYIISKFLLTFVTDFGPPVQCRSLTDLDSSNRLTDFCTSKSVRDLLVVLNKIATQRI